MLFYGLFRWFFSYLVPSWLVDHNNELNFVFSNAHEKVPNKIKFYLYMGGFPHCNLHLWFLKSLQYSFTGVYEPGIFQMFILEDRHTAVCTFTSDMPHSFMPLKTWPAMQYTASQAPLLTSTVSYSMFGVNILIMSKHQLYIHAWDSSLFHLLINVSCYQPCQGTGIELLHIWLVVKWYL